jgi:hypothetical protein
LTDNLNDHLTDANATEGTKSLDLTSALLKEGYLPQAREAEGRARAGIDELKNGIERAADSVIGDDTEALRMARSELDAVTDELKSEAAAAPGQNPPGGQNPEKNPTAAPAGEDRRQASAASQGNVQPGDQQGRSGNPPLASAAQDQRQAGSPAAGDAQSGDQQGQGGQAAGQNGRAAGNQARRLAGGDNRAASGQGGDPLDLANLIGGGGNRGMPLSGAPITGNGYGQWSDRLRDVEEIVDSPNLRNAVAAARESARLLRQDYTRDLKRPDWAVIQLQIIKPLIEVRDQISDELARRQSKDSLVPLDRDPVPNQYADSVRKYYEELGKDK